MPDRIIRAGILTSDSVDKLSASAEVFYRRLLSVVDDFGRFDGRASLLRAALYPLRISCVTEQQITDLLQECCAANLVQSYTVHSREYIEVTKFGQKSRCKSSKWPAPQTGAAKRSDKLSLTAPVVVVDVDVEDVFEVNTCAAAAARVRPATVQSSFAAFWEAYPRKRNKGQAETAWKRLAPDLPLVARIMTAIDQARRCPEWRLASGRYVPYPATWINAKGWEDELETDTKEKPNGKDHF